jgi:hypothetical protein
MVCGEICATPLDPNVFGGAVEGAMVVSRPNGELDVWAELEDFEDDDFEDEEEEIWFERAVQEE